MAKRSNTAKKPPLRVLKIPGAASRYAQTVQDFADAVAAGEVVEFMIVARYRGGMWESRVSDLDPTAPFAARVIATGLRLLLDMDEVQ